MDAPPAGARSGIDPTVSGRIKSAMIRNLLQRVRSSSTTLTMATGYLAMLSALGVGLFSVPVALGFLSDEEFGLWNIVGQSLGYLLLLDFGVSWSASRMLAGPLASGDSKELNSWWTVIVTILSIQGLLIAGVGLAVTDHVIDFFHLSSELVPDAVAPVGRTLFAWVASR